MQWIFSFPYIEKKEARSASFLEHVNDKRFQALSSSLIRAWTRAWSLVRTRMM